eukprot:g68264.t1
MTEASPAPEVQRDCYDAQYEWNAPQYHEFENDSAEEDDGKDTWFDTRRESGADVQPEEEKAPEVNASENTTNPKPPKTLEVLPQSQPEAVPPEPVSSEAEAAPEAIPEPLLPRGSLEPTEPTLEQIKRNISFTPQLHEPADSAVSRPRTRSAVRNLQQSEANEAKAQAKKKQGNKKITNKATTSRIKARQANANRTKATVRNQALGLTSVKTQKLTRRVVRSNRLGGFAKPTQAAASRVAATTRRAGVFSNRSRIVTRKTALTRRPPTASRRQLTRKPNPVLKRRKPQEASATASRPVAAGKRLRPIATATIGKTARIKTVREIKTGPEPEFPNFMKSTRSRMNALDILGTPSTQTSNKARTTTIRRTTKKPKLTVPKSPTFFTNQRLRGTQELSAEARLAEEQAAAAQKRRLVADSNARNAEIICHSVSTTAKASLLRSTAPLTQPEEFQFATDARMGPPTIRRHSPKPVPEPEPWEVAAKRDPITKPQEFKFATDERLSQWQANHPDQNRNVENPFVPLVNQVAAFWETKTEEEAPKAKGVKGPTIPQPPNLTRGGEKRMVTSLTTEERTLLELQSLPKFKARPVPEGMLQNSSGHVGLPRIHRVDTTEPVEVHLHTETRKRLQVVPEPTTFKARPLNRNMLDGPDPRTLILNCASKVTTPITPDLSFKKAPPKVAPKEDEEKSTMEELPVHVSSKPVPFHMRTDERGAVLKERLASKVQKEQEKLEQARLFKAQPVVNAKPFVPKPSQHLTKPAPFQLATDLRGAIIQQQLADKVEKEQQVVLPTFKAREMPSMIKQISMPKSDLPLTTMEPFELNSEARAAERAQFDQVTKKRQLEMEALREEEERRMEEEESQKFDQLRKEHLPKARPFVATSTPVVKKSTKPLTAPVSPALGPNRNRVTPYLQSGEHLFHYTSHSSATAPRSGLLLVPMAPQASLDLLWNPDWTDAEVYAQYLGPTGSLAAAEKLWHDIGHVIPVEAFHNYYPVTAPTVGLTRSLQVTALPGTTAGATSIPSSNQMVRQLCSPPDVHLRLRPVRVTLGRLRLLEQLR